MSIDKETLKHLAIAVVTEVEPSDVFVLEENFDALTSDWERAISLNEGRFIGGAEAASFAAVIVPFLLAFLGDIGKDIAKDQAKKISASLLSKLLQRRANVDEAERLRSEIEVAIAKSNVSREQKDILYDGFSTLFSSLTPPYDERCIATPTPRAVD